MAASELDVAIEGRDVRVRDAGNARGRPVLFLHGCPSSRLDLHLSEQLAADHGIRLISFDRPGYGRSSPAPFSLSTVSNDAVAIVDELGIETFAVLGQSAGSCYAMAVAAFHPNRVRCVGLASVAGPFDPGWIERLDADDRAILAILNDREAAAGLAATFFERPVELAAHAPDDELVAAFELTLSPADRALLRDPAIRAGAALNLREALRQGSQAPGWDVVAQWGPWGFEVTDVRSRVLIWFGDEDTAPVSGGRVLCDNLAQARLVLWPGEGHLAYKRHLEEILVELAAA